MVKIIITFFIILISFSCKSQFTSIDEIKLIDDKRISQLISDSINNFSISYMNRNTSTYQNTITKYSNRFKINSFTFSYDYQFNNKLPISYNDGNFFPAKGDQKRYSVGLNLHWKYFDFNLQPEIVNIENLPQEKFYGDIQDQNFWTRYFYQVANNIDNFRQFGNAPINFTSPGQSRIGIAGDKISFGYSSENFWWGPGLRNSLIFTNTSPGFYHYYFQTHKPIDFILGKLEFNAIYGQLDSLKFSDPDISIMNSIWSGAIIDKNPNTRNLYAFLFNINLKHLPNLYLGYGYSSQSYNNDFNKYGIKYSKFSNDKPKLSLGVLLFRFVLPKDHVEFYGELGLPNLSPWPWNFFSDTSKTGFILGARKVLPLRNKSSNFELSVELTQLSLMDPRNIFVSGYPFGVPKYNSWYTSPIIRQGHTNQAQLLGSSIGPGSNSQSINFSWNKGFSKVGIFFERIANNNDFYHYHYISERIGYSKADAYWVDINNGAYLQLCLLKNILLSVSYTNTLSMNYRWTKNFKAEDFAQPGIDSDKTNLQFKFSIKYLLNANH